jgi:hypothetical protein
MPDGKNKREKRQGSQGWGRGKKGSAVVRGRKS